MRIAHFTLATRDAARTSRFFAETLGWRPVERVSNAPVRGAWLEIGPGQEVHLAEIADFAPSPFEGEFGRHIAVTCPRADCAAVQERLRAHGAEVFLPTATAPVERFFFRSPDGYVLEVIAE